MRRLLRVVLAGVYTLIGGVWIVSAVALERRAGVPPHGLGRWAQRQWCRGLCRLLGARLVVRGDRPVPGPVLLVSNHVSWLDIVCLAALWPVAFLSKSEVRRWPVIGQAATALGTVYIERGRQAAAARAVAAMRDRLHAGARVLFFPEGTTGDGLGVRPFRARLYQAAIDAGAPVQAVALRYHTDDGHAEAVPFTDDQSLVTNLWQVAGYPRLTVTVTVGPPRTTEELGRSELARATCEDVRRGLRSGAAEEEAAAPEGILERS
ncbi:hypothetical protein KBTX_00643 [wastewater metagenome]|uniref:Phospholipid/glycerol acyltransferase domain-containing protein n=2 Tax=unclassified sequences TaxID=12908 RepID=A0A5B8RC33_9ZZZZ|nr:MULTISPECIES: lysophospholipid acyltransferase family protein [Arhodomonas]MCS4505744.1 1-acyl-sn-glycerol-3-phosphate acyltransferase [Arhodomonas aquaeolei]QEA04335.1 hypothetical protein KBTEX_00643 [uncultured organism]